MTQELTRYEVAAAPIAVTDEHIDLIRRTIAKDATPAELQLYLYDCQRHGVHPLDKLLHFTKRSNKYTPITSIDLLRSRAADTGELGGIDDPRYQGEPGTPSFAASVTVYRFVQGQRCPFTATARWTEYKPDQDHMWRKMPHLMLGKCAEALALRKAFPRQLAGLYAKEEMDQAGNTGASYLPPTPPANPVTGEVIDSPKPNGERPLVKRLRELVSECRAAGVSVPSLPKPKDMTDEQLDNAITDLEIELDTARLGSVAAEDPL
jgi:phage recombination protein Bet